MVSLLSSRAVLSLPKPRFRGGFRPSHGGGCFSPSLGFYLTLCEPFFPSLCPTFPHPHRKPTTSAAANPRLLAPQLFLSSDFGLKSLLSSPTPLCRLRLVLKEHHVSDLTGGYLVHDHSQATLHLSAHGSATYQGNLSIPFLLTPKPGSTLWNRPPPEPPPCRRMEHSLGMSVMPCSVPVLIRPPPKPNWFVSVSGFDAPGWFFFCTFGLMKCSGWSYHFWVHLVSVEAAGLEILSLVSSFSKSSAGTLVVINAFSFLSYRQVVFALVVWLDHRETTHSRTAHIPAKEMIRNWIDSKTVDSPPIMAIYHGRMLFAWLLGIAICFDVGPMWPIFYLCIVIKDLYVLIFRSNSITLLGYALKPFDHPECNVFSQLMK